MKTTQDIDQLFNMMNDTLNQDVSIPKVDLKELDEKYQKEKLKEHRSVRNRFIISGLLLTAYLVFGRNLQTKINILIFFPFLAKIIWINHQAKLALDQQNKAVSFTKFEEKKKEITESFYNQYKKIRTPIYIAMFTIAGVNLYYTLKNPGTIEVVLYTLLTLLGCFITIKSLRSLITKYKIQK
jgi:hypothetical protein